MRKWYNAVVILMFVVGVALYRRFRDLLPLGGRENRGQNRFGG